MFPAWLDGCSIPNLVFISVVTRPSKMCQCHSSDMYMCICISEALKVVIHSSANILMKLIFLMLTLSQMNTFELIFVVLEPVNKHFSH